MQLKSEIAAFAAAIMLGGCAGLAGSTPATFDLQAPPIEKIHGGGALQLTIYPPVAEAYFLGVHYLPAPVPGEACRGSREFGRFSRDSDESGPGLR